MMADLIFLEKANAVNLPEAVYHVHTVFPRDCGRIDIDAVFGENLSVNAMRMPRTVTQYRVFTHADYYMERDARPVPVDTGKALQWKDQVLVCL